MLKELRLVLVGAAFILGAAASPGASGGDDANAAARVFAASQSSPPLLRAFLFRMPKGADLHYHASGGVYAEDVIRIGVARGLCLDEKTATLSRPPCDAPGVQPLANAVKDSDLYDKLVDTWSMRDFHQGSGHDHFFDAFALFNAAVELTSIEAYSVERAGRQREQYMEIMTTFQGAAVRGLGSQVAWNPDFDTMRQSLMALGLPALVDKARADVKTAEDQRGLLLKCGTPQASEGCGVTVRYLQQITRTMPPNVVFAQALFGFLLAQAEPHVVGINIVAPEDDPRSLADYTLHMRIIGYLHGLMPNVGIALHAGELTLGLVPPDDLRSHIREAVELGHAQRIGHGVDLLYEDDPYGLLREMATRHVAVEINLTSNAAILGVTGNDHPFPVYMAAHVPTVISTDDEGIERIDLTNELQRAVTTYKLSYPTLIGLGRNSLEYAFVSGASLWGDTARWTPVKACAGVVGAKDPPAACAEFLHGSEKAQLQWQLEQQLRQFNAEAAAPPGNGPRP